MFLVKDVVDRKNLKTKKKQQFLIGKKVKLKGSIEIGKPIIFEHSNFKNREYKTKEITEILDCLDYIRVGTKNNYYYLEKLPVKIDWKRELKV